MGLSAQVGLNIPTLDRRSLCVESTGFPGHWLATGTGQHTVLQMLGIAKSVHRTASVKRAISLFSIAPRELHSLVAALTVHHVAASLEL